MLLCTQNQDLDKKKFIAHIEKIKRNTNVAFLFLQKLFLFLESCFLKLEFGNSIIHSSSVNKFELWLFYF